MERPIVHVVVLIIRSFYLSVGRPTVFVPIIMSFFFSVERYIVIVLIIIIRSFNFSVKRPIV